MTNITWAELTGIVWMLTGRLFQREGAIQDSVLSSRADELENIIAETVGSSQFPDQSHNKDQQHCNSSTAFAMLAVH